MNPEYDYTFYCDDRTDTEAFVHDAIEAFANQMIGLPDVIYLEFWRRLSLPQDEWTTIQYGAVPIQVRTPQDNGVPMQFENLSLRKDTAICARKRAMIPPAGSVPVPIVSSQPQ